MRSTCRPQLLLRRTPQRPRQAFQPSALHAPCVASQYQVRQRREASSPAYFQGKVNRFNRFENSAEEASSYAPRNPLNYIDFERRAYRRNQVLKKRIVAGCVGIAICVGLQIWIVFTYDDKEATAGQEKEKEKERVNGRGRLAERLDAPPSAEPADRKVVVKEKPGQPGVKLDEEGNEMVETGTSTIPLFPKTIQLPSANPSRASTPTSSIPGQGAQDSLEEYTLLGLGVRSVSFLSIQVYVLGLYVRTGDLEPLQAAFVKHVNPTGSSLIPSEKAALKASLMEADASLEIWDKVLRETGLRSAVRIVPTRNTDFNHLRDGWVRGITGRVQDLSRKGRTEFDDDSFGQAMAEFKAVLSGRGKAPKGSTVLLTRDESGSLGVMYVPEHKGGNKTNEVIETHKGGWQTMGRLAEERISRQVWLGYLGGKNVSSEGARASIVDGIMELVERPIGTVGTQVS